MKKLMFALLFVCSAANADQWLVMKNQDGGEIVFTSNTSATCPDKTKWMYAIGKDGTAYYGCWIYANGKAHVRYESGERKVYDPANMETRSDK